MNNTTITGRLTRDPEVRHNTGANGKLSVAKYTLAVRRPRAKDGKPTADFIRCTAFGPKATFAENYLAKADYNANGGYRGTEKPESTPAVQTEMRCG